MIGEIFNALFDAAGHDAAYRSTVVSPDAAVFQPAGRIDLLAYTAAGDRPLGSNTAPIFPDFTHEGTDNSLSGVIRIDLDEAGGDKFIDDRKERHLWARYLSSVLTTRSDTYCAYIVVRAYKADDFRSGPLETKRIMVLFDRSNIKGTAGETVTSLGGVGFVNE